MILGLVCFRLKVSRCSSSTTMTIDPARRTNRSDVQFRERINWRKNSCCSWMIRVKFMLFHRWSTIRSSFVLLSVPKMHQNMICTLHFKSFKRTPMEFSSNTTNIHRRHRFNPSAEISSFDEWPQCLPFFLNFRATTFPDKNDSFVFVYFCFLFFRLLSFFSFYMNSFLLYQFNLWSFLISCISFLYKINVLIYDLYQ